ncbi:hypothetical protein [Erythrobacter sp. MTPC3]|uniref:hypothetical protein n=1 Tax=Erythrobacter sp. MTPC3 TaxID=3056564 RepID=UPI0036F1F018
MPSDVVSTLLAITAWAAVGAGDPPCAHNAEALLALDFAAFDQTEGSGWRPLYKAGCYVEAAELLREYRKRRSDEIDGIIPFHEAQMWAYAGETEQALPLFEQSFRTDGAFSAVAWNLYVHGNIAFLRRNRSGLDGAAAALAALPKPAGWDNAVGVDGKRFSLPWPMNLNVLEAMQRCWDETHEVAAHCHLADWRKPRPAE